MAIVDMPRVYWPELTSTLGNGTGTPSLASLNMNTAATIIAYVIVVPKTGTLDWFELLWSTISNNPDNGVKFSFQDLDSNGDPDGTPDQYRDITAALTSNTWQAPPGVMTDDGTDTGVKRSVTAGDRLACVVSFVSFTAGDSVNVSVLLSNGTLPVNCCYPINGATPPYTHAGTVHPILALKYSDGTYAVLDTTAYPFKTFTATAFNTGSVFDERGIKFQVPVSMRTIGGWGRLDQDNPCDVLLYDSADSVLGSYSLTAGPRQSNSVAQMTGYWTGGPVTLSTGADYRLVVKPTTGSSITLAGYTVNSAGLRACFPGGALVSGTKRADAGAWTDSDTEFELCGLILDGVEAAGGGGSETAVPFFGMVS